MSITIRLKRNGPYVIAAEQASDVVIIDADGTTLIPEAGRSIALCRCGQSSTKPFCDRTHRESGFDGTVRWTECLAPSASVDPNVPAPERKDHV